MKVRMQVQLDPSDHDALKRWAARKGISTSAAVRLLVRTHVCGRGRLSKDVVTGFRKAAGCLEGRSGDEDASVRHDEILYGGRRRSR